MDSMEKAGGSPVKKRIDLSRNFGKGEYVLNPYTETYSKTIAKSAPQLLLNKSLAEPVNVYERVVPKAVSEERDIEDRDRFKDTKKQIIIDFIKKKPEASNNEILSYLKGLRQA